MRGVARLDEMMVVLIAVDATGPIAGMVGHQTLGVEEAHIRGMAVDPDCRGIGVTFSAGAAPTTTIAAITLSCGDGAAALAVAGSTGTVQSAFSAPDSGYEAWDGTSMATPHVSAVAALIWSCHPTKTNQQIRNALTSTALDRGANGRDTSYGFGIVRAKNALLDGLGGAGSCAVRPE